MSEERKLFQFPGKRVDVTWDKRLCIHVQECTRAKGELFAAGRKPWGQPDLGEADYVAEVVSRCPTGALTCRRKDGGPGEKAPSENRRIPPLPFSGSPPGWRTTAPGE